MRNQPDPGPAALYARVSSDRQDVDLSVAAQHGYAVAREYVDGAATGPLPGHSGLEVLPLHPQAGARRRLQGHAPAQG